jgi:N4-gp56 family major capsid protein
MATTTVLSGLELTKWRAKFIPEFVRDSGFEPYMGDSEMDIIHVVNDLKTDGYTIRIPLLARLQSAGVTGNERLSGSEETLDQYYQDISWDFARNAVEISKKEREKSAQDLIAAVRPRLKEWASERMKYKIIDCFHNMSDGTAYASASAATRNTFITNNSDRVLFGAAISNGSSNVMATALATVDSTNDKLTASVIRLAKRRARLARPIVRPFKTGTAGREYYVMFAHPHCFRDLKVDTEITAANREARAREGSGMDNNPLFQDGDLLFDGVIVREIPEFYQARIGSGVNTNTTLVGAGNGGIDVGVNFLCGAQAIGYVNKQLATPTKKSEDDYGFFDGMGVEVADGYSKLRWNNGSGTNKDLGIVTVYASGVADT